MYHTLKWTQKSWLSLWDTPICSLLNNEPNCLASIDWVILLTREATKWSDCIGPDRHGVTETVIQWQGLIDYLRHFLKTVTQKYKLASCSLQSKCVPLLEPNREADVLPNCPFDLCWLFYSMARHQNIFYYSYPGTLASNTNDFKTSSL